MKAWRTLLGLGTCSLLAVACTVSTGTSDDDDLGLGNGDEVDYDDDATTDDDADDDTSGDDDGDDDTGDDDTTTDDDADDDTTTDDDADDDTTTDDDGTADDDSSDDDATGDDDAPSAFMCMPESAEGDCEQCVQRADRCCDERAACANDPDGACEAEWTAIKSCMAERDLANNPDSDPVLVLQECMAEASASGSDLDVSDELFELTFCVGQAYMPMEAEAAAPDAGAPAPDAGAAEAPADDLIEGDGLCTFACYGVDTLEPVDLDEGSVDVR